VLVVLYGVGGDLFAYATGLRGGHLLAGGCGPRLQPGLRAAQLAAWAPFTQWAIMDCADCSIGVVRSAVRQILRRLLPRIGRRRSGGDGVRN